MANTQKNLTRRLVLSALLAALTCVMTMVVKIPSPLQGYINLGDGAVLLCGWVLNPVYGFLAAGIGSGLADLLSGYMTYVPATFVIKGLMALIVYGGTRLPWKKGTKILAGIVAEIVMVLGYYVFEGFLYGFVESAVNIPANAVQGVAGLILGLVLSNIFRKTNLFVKD
jgi:uncharacterized membrane protein